MSAPVPCRSSPLNILATSQKDHKNTGSWITHLLIYPHFLCMTPRLRAQRTWSRSPSIRNRLALPMVSRIGLVSDLIVLSRVSLSPMISFRIGTTIMVSSVPFLFPNCNGPFTGRPICWPLLLAIPLCTDQLCSKSGPIHLFTSLHQARSLHCPCWPPGFSTILIKSHS